MALTGSSPETVRLSNEEIRPFCDAMAQFSERASIIAAMWTAQGFAADPPAGLTNDVNDIVQDGEPEKSGRTAGSTADLWNVMSQVQAVVTVWNSPGVQDVILKLAVNPHRGA